MAAEYGENLTEREREITELVTEGLTNREIAGRLDLSHNTVKVHLRNVFTKTGVASRTELSMLAVQEGWVTIPGLEYESTPSAAEAEESAEATGEGPTTETSRPVWPWQRLAALGIGLALAVGVLVLPRRAAGPMAMAGPGEIFGSAEAAPPFVTQTTADIWQELGPLPVRRAGLSAAATNDKLYIIGGTSENGPTGRVDIYDIATGSWSEGASRPTRLTNASAASIATGILLAGGCDAGWVPSSGTDIYVPTRDIWQEAAPMPAPLCAYALTAFQGEVFIFGGWDGTAYRALAWAYNPESDSWRELAAPEQARGFGAAAALNDRMLYVGGYDGDREWATCEVYHPTQDAWSRCPAMLQPRGGLSLVSIGGRIYAIGGGWQAPLGFNERYTPATNEWSVMETPIVGEWRNLTAVPWETSIYAVGGWSSSDFLNRTYALEIMPWRVFIPGTFRAP
jgi:DNA-binding CsgD family transcriptional regulator